MKPSIVRSIALALSILCLGASNAVAAQTAPHAEDKPLYTDYPPLLCVGGGFVAMSGTGAHSQLVVIMIDSNGIEPPQTIPTGGDDVGGLQCSEEYVQVLVGKRGSSGRDSDRLFLALYRVDRYHGPISIQEKSREELDLPKGAPTPPALSYKLDSFRWESPGGQATRGDWYVGMREGCCYRNNVYEVHFVSTEVRHPTGGLTSTTDVTLLEESIDRKVTRSVPLVHVERFESGD